MPGLGMIGVVGGNGRRGPSWAARGVHATTTRIAALRVDDEGHPVVGDEVYGKHARRLTDRPLLHAHTISFQHPRKRLKVVIEAPIPEDMIDFISEHQ